MVEAGVGLVREVEAGINGYSSKVLRKWRGRNSSGRTESEAFPGEGWTFEIHFLADVAFKRRTYSSEDFRHDESALGYLMKFLGLHFFSDLISPMAYQINILIPI